MDKIDFSQMRWNIIAYCERENAYGDIIPEEWFILAGPFSTKKDAEIHQKEVEKVTKGTAAEWKEANASAIIVHDNDLAQYGLKPLN